jgi:hypothetical protein
MDSAICGTLSTIRACRAHVENCQVALVERNEPHRVVLSRDTRSSFFVMWHWIVSFRRYIADVASVPHGAGLVHRSILPNLISLKLLGQN